MANKMDAKTIGLTVLMGSGVVILTPMIASAVGGIELLSFEVIPGILSIGTALAAGVSAFFMDLAITKWLR